MYINKVILYGNLTKDPELRTLQGGSLTTSFTIATNRTWKDKEGQKKDEVQYHNVVAWGKTAELINQYVKKGNPLYVEGRLQTRSWEDKDKKKHYMTEVVVETMQFGPKKWNDNERTERDEEPEQNEPREVRSEDLPF